MVKFNWGLVGNLTSGCQTSKKNVAVWNRIYDRKIDREQYLCLNNAINCFLKIKYWRRNWKFSNGFLI